jgi:hypothetical protein
MPIDIFLAEVSLVYTFKYRQSSDPTAENITIVITDSNNVMRIFKNMGPREG